MSGSADLIRRREQVVCPGVGRISGMTAATAKGAAIIDADGREFIDFTGGIGVMNVGHCDPAVVRAIAEQSQRLLHTCIHVATYEPYIALCEKLVEILPHGDSTKAMLVNTGAEAVENAIKIARQATGRAAVICYTGGFHGRTLLCSTLTSKVEYKTGCGPFMPEVYRLPFPKGPSTRERRSGFDDAAVAACELARLKMALKDTVAPGNVAAIIIELVQGEGGFHVAPKAYIEGLRKICDEHGIVLIFDEVQSGFGRTGTWGACEHYGVTPDLSTWAKSMGGGLPISCVIGKASVMDKVTPGTLGGTYGGNPVACAAALATIESMRSQRLLERGTAIGQTMRTRFESAAADNPAITDVRGLGAMMAVEIMGGGTFTAPAAPVVKAITTACMQRGLLVISSGVMADTVRVLCPLVITDEQLDRGLTILLEEIERHTAAAATSAAPAPLKATMKG